MIRDWTAFKIKPLEKKMSTCIVYRGLHIEYIHGQTATEYSKPVNIRFFHTNLIRRSILLYTYSLASLSSHENRIGWRREILQRFTDRV